MLMKPAHFENVSWNGTSEHTVPGRSGMSAPSGVVPQVVPPVVSPWS